MLCDIIYPGPIDEVWIDSDLSNILLHCINVYGLTYILCIAYCVRKCTHSANPQY